MSVFKYHAFIFLDRPPPWRTEQVQPTSKSPENFTNERVFFADICLNWRLGCLDVPSKRDRNIPNCSTVNITKNWRGAGARRCSREAGLIYHIHCWAKTRSGAGNYSAGSWGHGWKHSTMDTTYSFTSLHLFNDSVTQLRHLAMK